MFASKDLFFTKNSGGYSIQKSVRLRSSATAYLNRTPASASNRKTWTWSSWVKRGQLGANQVLISSDVGTSVNTWMELGFTSGDALQVTSYSGQRSTTAVFRDPSAWYHVVFILDTTQAVEADRAKFYVNGVFQSQTGDAGFPALNTDYGINLNQAHAIGERNWASGVGRYFDGYLTEINFIDGQALTPTSFGAFNATTGVWQPIKYTGTYGTNGFYLNFSNNASTTTLGYDTSGNGNNWTTNNISLTAGSTYDSMTDVPTLTSATVANYAVMNPLNKGYSNISFSNGNLTISNSSAGGASYYASIVPDSGKYYFEGTATTVTGNFYEIFAGGLGYYSNGTKDGSTAFGATYTSGDIIGVAFDMGAGTTAFYKNGTIQGTQSGGSTGVILFGISNSGDTWNVNFGQRPFSYTPPTGFVALNTYNLPTPTIKNGAAYMAASLYTGTGYGASVPAGQTIVNSVNGVGFQPDFIWIKERSGTGYNIITDSVRGVTKNIYTNTTSAEATNNGTDVTTFNSNGFSVGTDSNGDGVNRNGASVVGWQWQAGKGSTSSNTNGSITSTVSVNATAGFSVVTYTGTGANATVGHGLGVAPSMIIVKSRSNAVDWQVYHASVGNGYYGVLDSSAAFATSGIWQNTSPTSSVFSVANYSGANYSSYTYVAYCWAQIPGYSKFGSYTGNGSADGPFVFTNFMPRWVMIKRTDSTSDWYIWDTSRDTYNVESATLLADTSGAETSATSIDGLSNGFKCRSSTVVNVSGGTYIFAAFAVSPFNYSLAR